MKNKENLNNDNKHFLLWLFYVEFFILVKRHILHYGICITGFLHYRLFEIKQWLATSPIYIGLVDTVRRPKILNRVGFLS